ncbi:hypothetical protein ACIQMY_34740 [Streptomyces sp. NPDC091368]|uniref:hypothetical protein n=1 Tax=Streptomyces sp. NPDC091368 TaxID=3365993 RepID=UPI0038128C55
MPDHDTLQEQLRAALDADDLWTALYSLNTDRPAALAAAAEELYRSDPDRDAFRPYLASLLQDLGEAGDDVLVRLLAVPTLSPRDRQDLLWATVVRRLRLPAALLRSCSEQPPAPGDDETNGHSPLTPTLIDAMGLSGDPSFAPRLGAFLDDPAVRRRAALALGRLGAREWTAPIASRLSAVTGLEHTAFAVALELLDDPVAVPYLLRWLAESGEERVHDVHLALVRLTGRDPLLPEGARGAVYASAVRAAWAEGRTERAPAVVRDVVVESDALARFSVDEGAGRIRIVFDPPSPSSGWPRWNRSLTFDGKPLYGVGSLCDTCELGLTLLDWPDEAAARIAARMRGRLADLDRLDTALLAEWTPVLGELETGHYRAVLLDLPLEEVTEPARSWWHRRAAARAEEDGDETEYAGSPVEDSWPGVAHLQLTAPVAGGRLPRTYGALLPSQPPEALDPATVARHAAAIAEGKRPAAVVLGWIDDRYVRAEHEERWLVGAVLDGHHRLAAYAAAGVPARVLLLAREGEGADSGTEGLAEMVAAYACRA